MRIPCRPLAHLLRRAGLRLATLAKYFTPERDEEIFLKKLWKEVEWHSKLSALTDEQLAAVVTHEANDLFGTENSVIVTEVVTRLSRTKAGANP
jgi:hypothetical protein